MKQPQKAELLSDFRTYDHRRAGRGRGWGGAGDAVPPFAESFGQNTDGSGKSTGEKHIKRQSTPDL